MLAQSLDELIEESIEKGKEEGLELGLEQGRRTGSLLGKKEALLRMMRKKYELSEEESDLVLKVDSVGKIDDAIDEILTADSKEVILDIFRE